MRHYYRYVNHVGGGTFHSKMFEKHFTVKCSKNGSSYFVHYLIWHIPKNTQLPCRTFSFAFVQIHFTHISPWNTQRAGLLQCYNIVKYLGDQSVFVLHQYTTKIQKGLTSNAELNGKIKN